MKILLIKELTINTNYIMPNYVKTAVEHLDYMKVVVQLYVTGWDGE